MSRRAAVGVALGVAAALALAGRAEAQSVDFLRQSVSIDLTGPGTAITIDLELEATGDAMVLDLLRPPLPIRALTVDGVPATVSSHPQAPTQAIRVRYPAALTAGQRATVHLEVAGDLACGGGSAGLRCVRRADLTVLPPASPGMAWYLLDVWDADPFDAEVDVRVARGQRALAAHGAPRSIDDLGDGTERWRFGLAVPGEGFALVAGELTEVAVDAPSAASGYYPALGGAEGRLGEAVTLAAELAPIYRRLLGEAPFDRVRIVSVPAGFPFGGLGLLGTLLLGEYVFDPRADYLLEQGTAHELAHTWWGNLCSASDPAEAGFFNEAFAELSAWRALGERAGPAARTAGARMNAVWYMYRRPSDDDVAILDPAVADSPLYVFATYHKGSAVLRTLETWVGEAAFLRAQRALIARGLAGVSEDALIEALSRESSEDVGPLVRAWLEAPGFPRLTVTATRTAEGALHLAIDGASPAPLRLPLVWHDARGDAHAELWEVGRGRAERTLEGAEVVELDPAWATLRELTPARAGDVTFDGEVDGADLVEVALRTGAALPTVRRQDGGYDPLYDVDGDRRVGDADLERVVEAAR